MSARRSAKFCSCSVCARSSTVCSSSWTRPQSTCSGLQSLTLLGGKVINARCGCTIWSNVFSSWYLLNLFQLTKKRWAENPGPLTQSWTSCRMWLMMLNFFPHHIGHGEYQLKFSQFCLKPHFYDSNILSSTICTSVLSLISCVKHIAIHCVVACLGLNPVVSEKWLHYWRM